MKEGWLTQSLGEVCALATGGTPNTKIAEYWQGGEIPWLVSGDVHKKQVWDCAKRITQLGMRNSNARILPADSVLIALNGQGKTRGTVAMLRIPATCNQSVVCMTPIERNRLLAEYLFYYLESQYQCIRDTTGDKDRRGLNMPLLRAIEVPIAPVAEQRRIVAILDEVFGNIATARTNAEKNLGNARAIFESHLDSMFTQRTEGSVEKTLGELCPLFVDSAHRTPRYQAAGIPALRPRDVANGELNLGGVALVSEEEYDIQSKRHRPAPGDIVYSRELSCGWAVLLPELPRACLSQGMCLFRPAPERLDSRFLQYVLNSPFGRRQAMRAAVGAAHPHINLGDIKAYRIPLPSLPEQEDIVKRLDAAGIETRRLESIYRRKLDALDALKQSLLHHAFSGQL